MRDLPRNEDGKTGTPFLATPSQKQRAGDVVQRNFRVTLRMSLTAREFLATEEGLMKRRKIFQADIKKSPEGDSVYRTTPAGNQ